MPTWMAGGNFQTSCEPGQETTYTFKQPYLGPVELGVFVLALNTDSAFYSFHSTLMYHLSYPPHGCHRYHVLVDRPTQLICVSDIYLSTDTKDKAGLSANHVHESSQYQFS